MTRVEASQLLRVALNENGLTDWSVRLNQNADSRFLGLCSYKDKCIILSAHHIDIHPTESVINTILHEVAHALCPGCSHNDTWAAKARELGCDNTLPCSNLALSPEIIDAIRSGADIEVSFEEQVIRTPKYTITRLQDKCEYCGRVAKSVKEDFFVSPEGMPDLKIILLECGHTILRNIPKGTPFHTFQMGGSEDCLHQWDKNNCIKCSRKKPYDFQIKGMEFLEAAIASAKGGSILDEMGLGKTIQAMGYVFFHPEVWPVLWVVKSGLKYQTAIALMMWMGTDIHLPQIIETSKDYLIPGMKHYIVGYDMMVQKTRTLKSGKVVTSGFDISQFDRVGIKLVVLDECQQIKNADSSRTQMIRRVVKDRKVIALSGTPWKNRGSELFPMLNMIDPVKFYSAEKFKRDWVETYWHGNQLKEGGIRNIARFKEHTKDLLIRRERTEVMPELPLINRTKLYVKMDPQYADTYDAAVKEFVEWYEAQIGEISGMDILAAMAKMRHLVGLAKVSATEEYIDEFIEDTDRKIVVFAHHQDVQTILFEDLKRRYQDHENFTMGEEIVVLKIDSSMSGEQRNNAADTFNRSKRAILVASTLAAGEGLNLQTCSDCILHERQWNPANEEQAEGRFIRIGQTAETVNAIYTEMQGLTTIDPKLDEIVERKRHYFHKTMNSGEAPVWSDDSTAKELAETIVNGYRRKSA